MGTTATIAMKQDDNTYLAITCNYDGYEDGVGRTLKTDYNDPEKIKELIKLGNLSSICDKVIAYTRDHKEPWHYNKPQKFNTMFKAIKFSRNTDHGYIWDGTEWQSV
ncbi:MAG: hypothetical protein HON94_16150 [Methylococcales bacterium]|jgi:hypothetical protein|nr:hypothetical protein [Methylococcales bacterium]